MLDISLAVSPIISEDGRIVGASKIARDITARKRAEEDVRRSREALNSLVDQAPFGIYIVDSELKLAQMNARSQAGAFFNVRPVIGRDLAEVMRILWPEPVAAEIIAAFERTLETGDAYRSRDFSSPRADTDNVESYEWELHRITLPDGRPGVVCYYFDSTRLRRRRAGSARGRPAQGRVPRHARARAAQPAGADPQRACRSCGSAAPAPRPSRRSTR